MKILLFDIRFPYKHCYFKICLLTHQDGFQNRDKVYSITVVYLIIAIYKLSSKTLTLILFSDSIVASLL